MIKKYALLLLLLSAYSVTAQPFTWPTVDKQIQLQSTALPVGTGCYAALKLFPYSRLAAFSAVTVGGIWGLLNNRKFSTKSISVLPLKNGGL
jgi:hypothetical protein